MTAHAFGLAAAGVFGFVAIVLAIVAIGYWIDAVNAYLWRRKHRRF